jgi:hypothetical protein
MRAGDLEELMVKAFPYEIPKEYANLPQVCTTAHPHAHVYTCMHTTLKHVSPRLLERVRPLETSSKRRGAKP